MRTLDRPEWRVFLGFCWCIVNLIAAPFALAVEAKPSQAASAGPKYELRYKFKPGETIRTKVLHQAAIRTTIDGTSQNAATVSTSIKVWKIEDINSEGHIQFVHSVDHVKMRNEVSGREDANYDSRVDTKPPTGFEDVAKRVGVPLTRVTIDNRGTILHRNELAPPGPGQGTQLTLPLPKEAVGVGDTWTFPNDMRVRLKSGEIKNIKSQQKFTLRSVEGDMAEILVETQILTPVRDPEIEAQVIEQETNGTIRFDLATGRLIRQQVDLDRSVVGYPNVKSSMHYRTRFTEELLKEDARTAEREPAPRTKK